MGKIISLSGQVFGRLTAVSFSHIGKHGGSVWSCSCDCGRFVVVASNQLQSGKTKSCGCWRRDQASSINRTHGLSMRNGRSTYTYRIWAGMRSRCHNPRAPFYDRYGGSGISICDRWESYQKFVQDMGEVDRGMSLDRIDPSLGYFPENCRWATPGGQARNRRMPRSNTSGLKNVMLRKNKWYVGITAYRRKYSWGPFDDRELAELFAHEARRKYHGEFANHD